MNAEELLGELNTRRIAAEPRGDALHIEAPRGMLTPELKAALLESKRELLVLLRQDPWRSTFTCPGCAWPLPVARRPRCCLACGWHEQSGHDR